MTTPTIVTITPQSASVLGQAAEAMRDAQRSAGRRIDPGSTSPADRLPFVRSPEVAEVAASLMDRFPSLAHLGEWRIDYWFETKLPKPRGGCATIGKASVDSDIVSARTGYDALVVVNQPWWLNADANKRQALVYHELCHFDTHVDETGGATLRTVKHDLEMFIGEAAHFGDWRHGIAEVAEQLAMWRDSVSR